MQRAIGIGETWRGWGAILALAAALWSADARAQPQISTGVWWNAQAPGNGYAVEVAGNRALFVALAYRSSGTSAWYLASGPLFSVGVLNTDLVEYGGGQTLLGSYRPPSSATTVGHVALSAATTSQGSLVYTGGSTVPIQRYEFVDGGFNGGVSAAAPQTGWWWNPSEAGRGYFIETQGSRLYLLALVYDADGTSRWYSATGDLAIGAFGLAPTVTATLSEYRGGQTLLGPYSSPSVATAQGQVTLVFSSLTSGTLTLPNGAQVAITRYTSF
jgi:hypothetical protein